MKHNVYFGIAFRIILVFGTGIMASFLPDLMRDFLGDKPFAPYEVYYGLKREDGQIDGDWIWGARHYWFFWMMVMLFILSVVSSVISIYNLIVKNYPELR